VPAGGPPAGAAEEPPSPTDASPAPRREAAETKETGAPDTDDALLAELAGPVVGAKTSWADLADEEPELPSKTESVILLRTRPGSLRSSQNGAKPAAQPESPPLRSSPTSYADAARRGR
jgi:hypothetical protein